MRLLPFGLLAFAACDKLEDPKQASVLETTATTYVAVENPDPRFDYSLTVIAKLRNTSGDAVRISRCLPQSSDPTYWVEKPTTGTSAWDPDVACQATGTIFKQVAPGGETLDTISMVAPWRRTFLGQPIGDVEGTFYLVYETRICTSVSSLGVCSPIDRREYVRSNHFTITK